MRVGITQSPPADRESGVRKLGDFEAPSSACEVAQLLTWTGREGALGDLDPCKHMFAIPEAAVDRDLPLLRARLRADVSGDVTPYSAR